MAETVLIPVAKQILGKLGHLALEQIGLLWTLKREILKLQNTISTIQAVLLDAEEKQTHNHQVKDWLEKLSDVMYDADDLLDDFSTEARRQAMAEADGSSRQLINELKMAHDIRAIREKLDDITKDKDRLHLEVRFEEAESSRETDSCPPTIVVGREDDKKNIIQLLLSSNFGAKLSVFPIVGIGGLGKTTLAQLVFDDYQVQAHFGIKVWVHVSQSFDVKVILEKMLQSITRQSQTGLGLDVVRAQIRDVIEDKRFLVVLDDVWEETVESWESLGKYLTVGAHGSKVLVTTRSTRVAEVVSRALSVDTNTRIAVPYQLEGLTLKESWNLLVNKALNGRTPQNPLVERIGVKILEKCYGVPLAVSSVSGILSSKNQETEWQRFLENDLGSIYGEENACVLTLKLSYNHLPPHMKRCFAYCKLFPKGHAFDVQMLHLRFLCFKCQRMESLPDSISNLLNLQVLKVNCYGLKELSRDIKHLTDLNHLHFDGVFMTHMPKGIGELKSLQKLPYFVVGKGHQVGGLDELKELNALHGELIISNLVNVESSRKLTHLFMWEIADLESLPGEYLCNLTSLRFLSIYKCPRLASLPPAMRQLTSLKTVHISDCPQLSQRCQKGVGEDWPNISHTSYAEPGERMIQFLRSELSQYNC
ncbi:Putative disease resistance protein RGA4 [Linum perenne]